MLVSICQGAGLTDAGLTFYVWTKLAIYFYFTERSFLVWSKRNSTRATNKLYVFNMVVICGTSPSAHGARLTIQAATSSSSC
jgi:hypothetical protein